MAQARDALRKFAGASGAAVVYEGTQCGPPHRRLFSAHAQWTDSGGRVVEGGAALAWRKNHAHEAAARRLLQDLGHHDPHVNAVDAPCGLKTIGLLVGLGGRKARLSAAGLAKAEEELVSKKAMHGVAAQTHDVQQLGFARTWVKLGFARTRIKHCDIGAARG
jgi:hypothetical protein